MERERDMDIETEYPYLIFLNFSANAQWRERTMNHVWPTKISKFKVQKKVKKNHTPKKKTKTQIKQAESNPNKPTGIKIGKLQKNKNKYNFLSMGTKKIRSWTPITPIITLIGFAVRRIFKKRQRKLLLSKPNIKMYKPRFRIINWDILNRQPKKKLFLRQPFNRRETPVSQVSPDDAFVKRHGVEFRQTWPVEVYLEEPCLGERERFDGFREEAGRKAVGSEEVVDGGRGGERDGEEREEEEEEEWEMGLNDSHEWMIFLEREAKGLGGFRSCVFFWGNMEGVWKVERLFKKVFN